MRIARTAIIVGTLGIALLVWLSPALAEKRVALVIGNGAYQKASRLANPANDSMAIAGMLKGAGFAQVELHQNLGIRELRQAINEFADIARDADTAVVYYSGHGIEVDGINYLIPIDAVLDRDTDVPYETFSLDNLVRLLEPARRLRLVMLDACRDNPFVRSMKRTVGTRTVGRGLAAVEPTSVNTLIGFAAKAGSFALDGEGRNSPYATAVLNHLATPGLDLRIAFGRVRDEVLRTTKSRQEPFVYGSLGGSNVSIVDAPAPAAASPAAQAPSASSDPAAQAWMVAKDTTSMAVLEDFIRHFGDSFYASLARARLEELKKNQVAVIPPRVPQTAPATEPKPPAAAIQLSSLIGRWQYVAKCDTGEESGSVELVQNGSEFSGSFSDGFSRISNGQLQGNRVSFNQNIGPISRRVDMSLSSVSGRLTMVGSIQTITKGKCVITCRKN